MQHVVATVLTALCTAGISVATVAQTNSPEAASSSQPLDEVTVTAKRTLDKHTLTVAVSRFVELHAKLSPRSGQIGRWITPICPKVFGVKGPYDEYVEERIEAVAQRVGAPGKRHAGRCTTNAEIVFTRDPEGTEALAAKSAPWMLGDAPRPKQGVHAHHPIEAWYATATGDEHSVEDRVDSPFGIVMHDEGRHPSRLSDVESHIRNVLVVVDATQVRLSSLATISDYVAMIVLTRTALDGCNALPSIIDLLSPDCGSRARPQSLTSTDEAYLKALYAARFGMKVDFEQGEIRDRVLRAMGR